MGSGSVGSSLVSHIRCLHLLAMASRPGEFPQQRRRGGGELSRRHDGGSNPFDMADSMMSQMMGSMIGGGMLGGGMMGGSMLGGGMGRGGLLGGMDGAMAQIIEGSRNGGSGSGGGGSYSYSSCCVSSSASSSAAGQPHTVHYRCVGCQSPRRACC